jgi:hypothetical protein
MDVQDLLNIINEQQKALDIKEETIQNLQREKRYWRDSLLFRIKCLEDSLHDRNETIKKLRGGT